MSQQLLCATHETVKVLGTSLDATVRRAGRSSGECSSIKAFFANDARVDCPVKQSSDQRNDCAESCCVACSAKWRLYSSVKHAHRSCRVKGSCRSVQRLQVCVCQADQHKSLLQLGSGEHNRQSSGSICRQELWPISLAIASWSTLVSAFWLLPQHKKLKLFQSSIFGGRRTSSAECSIRQSSVGCSCSIEA